MDVIQTKIRHFLREDLSLDIPEDLSFLPPSSRLQLLNNAIERFSFRIPFQNILLMSEAPELRRLPTLEELVDDVVAGRGGLCYTNNTFFKYALEVLGFEAFHVAASVSQPHSHIIIGVRHVVQAGDCYLVEVGCGYPSFSAISMDFVRESPTLKDSFCTYKLVKKEGNDDGPYPTYERWQRRDAVRVVAPADIRGDDAAWFRFYDFMLEPRSLEHFRPYIGPLYENPPARGPFHKMISMSQFPEGRGVTLKSVVVPKEDKSVRKLVLIAEQADGAAKKTEFLVDEEVQFRRAMETAGNLFPALREMIGKAFGNFEILEL